MVDTAPVEPQAPPVQRRPEQRTAPSPRTRGRPRETLSAPVPAARPVTTASRPHSTATLIGSVQRAMRLLESVAAHEHGAPAKQLARETGLALPDRLSPAADARLSRAICGGRKGVFFLGEAAERLGSSGARQKRRSTVVDVARALAGRHRRPRVLRGVPRRRDRGHVRRRHPRQPGGRGVGRLPRDRPRARDRTVPARPARRAVPARIISTATPYRPLTPYTVRDSHTLLRRLDRMRRMEPVVERQEYALGTVCAAIPITVGSTAATMAISLPSHQADRLLDAAQQLQTEVGRLLGSLAISISI